MIVLLLLPGVAYFYLEPAYPIAIALDGTHLESIVFRLDKNRHTYLEIKLTAQTSS
jgi:hypothetical protein